MRKLYLLLFFILSLSAGATNYYISSSGDDANNGTSASTPWKTIAKINGRTFSPGDFILFKRGDTWREQITIPSSGSAGNPLTFGAYGTGAKPIINGADVITGWTNSAPNIWWVRNPNAVSSRAMVIIDGVIYAEQTSLGALTSANKYFIDVASAPDRLYVYSTIDPGTRTAEISKREYCIVTASGSNSKRFIEINDIEVRYAGRSGIYFEGPGSSTANALDGSSIVRRCVAYANRLFGMVHYDHYDNVLFEECEANYNGNGFYSWVADEGTFRKCSTANQIQYSVTFTDGHSIGGYQSNNWTVENCYSINDHDAIHIDAGGVAANAIIRYNKVFNSRPGSPSTPGMGVGSSGAGSTIQIYYNLIVNCASSILESYSVHKGKVLVYNNTMYLNNASGSNGTVYLAYGENFVFKNNIIMRDGGGKTLLALLRPGLCVSDYNQFYQSDPTSSPVRFHYNGANYTTLAAWAAATNQDVHSQSTDPLFVNKSSDWSLKAGSPAINKGVNVGLTKDIAGNPIVGLPDMGAYEYVNAIGKPTADAGADQSIALPVNTVSLNANGTTPVGSISAYMWTKISGPAPGAITDVNSASTSVTGLVEGVYQFQLNVTDNNGATDTDDMIVTVNAAPVINQSPTADAGNNTILTLPTKTTTLTGGGTDPDGTITSYAWGRVSGPATFTLASPNTATTTVSDLVQGTYVFRLTVTDNDGATDTDDMTVTVNAAPIVNQAPIAEAGNNIILTLPTKTTTLTGKGTDPDGTITSYAWSRVSGPATFTLGSPNTATTIVNDLVQGTYVFRLTVTDNDGAIDTDDMTVTVNAAPIVNQVPTADAGNNIILTLPTKTTTLTGKGTDPDGTITSYAWSRVSGPATFTLGSPNTATTTLSDLVQGTYVFRLTVTDNDGATDTDDMTVTVNAAPIVNQAPTADAGNNIILTLPTKTTTLTGKGTDPDGTITSYAWSRVSGPATFTLGSPNTATTTLSDLVQGTYVFRLTVTDNDGAIDTDDMTVTVNVAPIVNQVPTADAGNNIILTLPTKTTTLTGKGTDPDGTITSYAWSRVSGPATFTLASPNTATTIVNDLVQGTYVFRLTVTDNDGATDTDDMTVTVNAAPIVNQAPIAEAGNNIILTLPTKATTLTGKGTDPDGTITSYAWSRVSGPATFTLGSPNTATTTLSDLVQGTYVFRLTVTDNDGAIDTDDMTVTVNAAPIVNQVPTADAGNNIILTLPTKTTTLTGKGTDPDGTITSYAWSRVSGPATFTLASPNTATTIVNDLVQGTYVFRLTVTDNDGATDTDDMTVTVNAAPIVNQAPTADAGNNIILTLPTKATTLTGKGTDPDGTITSYAWSRVSGPATFTLASPNTATTTVSDLVQGTYVFRLTVTDNDGATDTDDMTVTVNAAPIVNQAPTADAGNNIILTLPTKATTLTGKGTDPDGTIASYAWSRVSGPATFTLASPNTATTIVNDLVQGTYVFRLTVTDNDGAIDTDDMTVTVNAAAVPTNRPPIAKAGPDQAITVNSNSATLNGNTSYDPDGIISSYQWQQIAGPGTSTFSSASAAIITLSNLKEGTYTYRLTVRDNKNATATDTINVTVVNNFRSYGSVALYPNPVTDIVNIVLNNDSSGTVHVNIYDMQGRKVMRKEEIDKPAGFFTISINVSQLASGIYNVEIIEPRHKKTASKLVKL